MTRKELSQIYYMDKELHRAEENMKELQEAIHAKTQQLTGMPGQKYKSGSSEVEQLALSLMQAVETVNGYKDAIIIRKAHIMEWLTTLDDYLLKQIVDYRCLRLMEWDQVAACIGSGISEDGCRMYFNRKIPK